MIRVLVVDDSALVRSILSQELSKFPDITVIDTAMDPYVARDKIVKLKPDVVTLDIEMPRMDGLSFLAKLMKYHPVPVVIVSSLAPKNSELALKALLLGAVEVIMKPGSAYSTSNITFQIAQAIRAAAMARIRTGEKVEEPFTDPKQSPKVQFKTTDKIIAIGASTGGTQAIEMILRGFEPGMPGTVIVQHMPPNFTTAFAARLDTVCQIEVREAKDGDRVLPGLALIAPGNFHMLLEKSGTYYYVNVKDGPMVHHQRPSVDVMFYSVARTAGPNAIGVILTGMGKDGAKGMLAMKETGAYNIAQDEASSVVFGMPKEAIDIKAVQDVVPLDAITGKLVHFLNRSGS